MSAPPTLAAILAELGAPATGDLLAALDAFVGDESAAARARAAKLIAALEPRRGDAGPDRERALAALALGTARLVRGEAEAARGPLLDALGRAAPEDVRLTGRAQLRVARALIALDDRRGAVLLLQRAASACAAADDDLLLGELGRTLARAGEMAASEVLAHLAAERDRSRDVSRTRLEFVARLTSLLNSAVVATAEPLHSILRSVLAATRADRGFVLLHGAGGLEFEVGLAGSGRVLRRDDFQYSRTIVQEALETRRCVLIPDLLAWKSFAAAESAHALGIRSALCLPLRVAPDEEGDARDPVVPQAGGIAGVIGVDSATAGSFGERDLSFFELLSDFAALAVRAMRMAARLGAAEAALLEQRPARRSPRRARPAALATGERASSGAPRATFGGLVTQDPGMIAVLERAARVVDRNAPLVLRGETGTGKELLARAIHARSARRGGRFVTADCVSIPEALLGAELFGFDAGAFSGADEARPGLFEVAHGGTLFLDEIGEATAAFQAALLRVLQEGEVRRLGSSGPRKVDVRVVASTQHDLSGLVAKGTFRQDLYYRLSVVELALPPLREREGDVAMLADAFLERAVKKHSPDATPPALEPGARARLAAHRWPGNVRELESVVQKLLVATGGARPIKLADVVAVLGEAAEPAPRPETAEPATAETLEAIEKAAIIDRLERCGWNQVRAAESLGIDRRTLYRKIRRLGIGREGPG